MGDQIRIINDEELKVGEQVVKIKGDYKFDGHIVAIFTKRCGAIRYVVENKDGILHIFSRNNLIILPDLSQ